MRNAAGIDTSEPHSARVYDYILGGKTHFPADREAADDLRAAWPKLPTSMRINRATMHRMGRWLAAEEGITQFLDIGTGIPTEPNLHQIVQEITPASRVVYVDNDPLVLTHARALLASTPEGRTRYLEADLREPGGVFGSPELLETLDLSRPVGVTVIAMLQFVEDAAGLVRELTASLAPGSCLALTTATGDITPDEVTEMAQRYTDRGVPMYLRTRDEVVALFDGMELVEPGVVPMNRWRPDPGAPPVPDTDVNMYAGVGRVV
ncbi:SAM-dependent methyltransferase [Streptomyces boncukensis]|uniref:SAM-dependent methyltransferase n=1 Tax=Streptomyces boncukensis TaxID=2711219 RepID=A0A6G4X4M4_9ACTN|nr:SAM-dependent methyltransferase [Streptomyces boncukensis]